MASSLFPLELEPGVSCGVRVLPEEARSILRPQRDERYGFGFALSPYRGCTHSCRYCFVREYPNALHGPDEWGGWCAPKLNAPDLLWAQRRRLHRQSVFMSTATDPYQPIEGEYRLTRRCLRVLLECHSTAVLLHTRSPLVLQDLDLLKEFGPRLHVGISIPTDDDTIRQVIEPRASAIPLRWTTAERLAGAGIHVSIAATPMFPMQNVAAFVGRCVGCGAKGAWAGHLRLIKGDRFRAVLERHGWTRVLEDGFGSELRAMLAGAFRGHELCAVKPRRSERIAQSEQSAERPRAGAAGSQPSLFQTL
jgi:DNA repair photolyase